jgi:hypothetical protein
MPTKKAVTPINIKYNANTFQPIRGRTVGEGLTAADILINIIIIPILTDVRNGDTSISASERENQSQEMTSLNGPNRTMTTTQGTTTTVTAPPGSKIGPITVTPLTYTYLNGTWNFVVSYQLLRGWSSLDISEYLK